MRIPLKASSLLIGLGLLLSLTAAASGLADKQRNASPFDQVDGPDPDSQGFDPIVVPLADLSEPPRAPTLPTQSPGLDPGLPIPTAASETSASPPIAAKASGAGEGPAPTATPAPFLIPDRLAIPAIQLDAPVVPAKLAEIESWGKLYQQWVAPSAFKAGWHTTSAPLGVVGNTVLNGHHNIRREVFGHLADLETGDLIWVYSGARSFVYRIVMITILPERWQSLDVRLANARWIEPSNDERLTLVTCWPYASNTHRLVIVATPVNLAGLGEYEIVPRLTPHPPVSQ